MYRTVLYLDLMFFNIMFNLKRLLLTNFVIAVVYSTRRIMEFGCTWVRFECKYRQIYMHWHGRNCGFWISKFACYNAKYPANILVLYNEVCIDKCKAAKHCSQGAFCKMCSHGAICKHCFVCVVLSSTRFWWLLQSWYIPVVLLLCVWSVHKLHIYISMYTVCIFSFFYYSN